MPVKKVKTTLFKSGWGYKVDIRRKGLKRIRRTFPTRELAQQVHDAIAGDYVRRAYNLPVAARVTLGDLIDKHMLAMRRRGRDRVNTVRAETVLERFAALIGRDRSVESIRTADLGRYVDSRYSSKALHGPADRRISPQTINRELSEIKACLSSARRHFSDLTNYRSPEAPWQEEPSDGRRQTWTPEQVAALLAELRQPQRPREKPDNVECRLAVADMFEVALQTGLRAGEVRRLKRSQVDFSRGLIVVTSKKGLSKSRSGQTREVPMTPEVEAILRRRAARVKTEHLFPGQEGDRPMSKHNKPFITACQRAKIPYGLHSEGGLVFNDARRTAENNMLDAGHQPRTVGDILGHSPATQARHYARSTPASRRAAVEATRRTVPEMDSRKGEPGESGESSEPKSRRKTRATM